MLFGRPAAVVGALSILVAAVGVFTLAVVWGVINDGLWVGGIEGFTYEAPVAVVVGYGPFVPIGAWLVWAFVRGRSMACVVGFGAWFAVVAVDLIVLGSPATTPAFIGALPLTLAYAGRTWFVQEEFTK